jgi:phosphopantothenoylcysteine decarboxylase/phosphopantothenate--cysteine ligase
VRWLVTAGPTCEDIDPVRFISNRSSGRMGYAVAASAACRGHAVTLVTGPVVLAPPEGVETVGVRSAEEMRKAVVSRFDSTDVVVMAAAVADYRPRKAAAHKLHKGEGGIVIELERTPDILSELGRLKSGQVLIGFALETPSEGESEGEEFTETMVASAERKLASKNLDAIVLNAASAMGGEGSHIRVLVRGSGWEDWGEAAKCAHARRLVELAERQVRSSGGPI